MTAVKKIPIYSVRSGRVDDVDPVVKSEEEWRVILAPRVLEIARKKGTEPAFTGRYHDCKRPGTYQCVCCGTDLFSSGAKFDSGTGWPSFFAPVSHLNVRTATDKSNDMVRIEVLCSRCGAHLGHVFDDGPPPTHKRYCMNSLSLKLVQYPP